jgi:hypothetical protein
MGLVHWLIGDSGMAIAAWIRENILWFATPIFIFALFYRYDTKKRLKIWLNDLWGKWRKTKFSMPEEDRKIIDEYKERARNKYLKK